MSTSWHQDIEILTLHSLLPVSQLLLFSSSARKVSQRMQVKNIVRGQLGKTCVSHLRNRYPTLRSVLQLGNELSLKYGSLLPEGISGLEYGLQ